MNDALEIPAGDAVLLCNARVHEAMALGAGGQGDADGFVLADIALAKGRIGAVRPAGWPWPPEEAPPRVELGGRIVMPAFVDCHTHLDKGHIWARSPNPDGSFAAAVEASGADRASRWDADDLARRIDFGLRTAFAHGTKAIRTHLDSAAPQECISWPVLEEFRRRWRGRIALQGAALIGIEEVRDAAWFGGLVRLVAAAGGVLGAVATMVPDLEALLDRVFAAASEHGLDLDFHADETDAIDAHGLRRIAEAALRTGFQGKVLVGHCCALSLQPDHDVLETLDKVARAGLAVVSLPMCNLYLQDRRRDGTTPRWRGVTLVHEMKARGIALAVASDNTRDPFYAYGDLDMLEVYRMATRILHLDHPVGDWPRSIAATPAEIMRLDDAGLIAAGRSADLVIFRGRSLTELLSRPESDRVVLRNGAAIARELPDYAELDDVMGA